MSNIYSYLVIPQHAVQRFCERKVGDKEMLKFLRHVKLHFCEMVFDCIIYGNVDGSSRQLKFGKNRFIYTYDTIKRKLVLKTVIGSSDKS